MTPVEHTMPNTEYIEANRQMWNATAAVHAQAYVNDLLTRIAAPDFTTFDVVEQRLFAQIGLDGKAVIQLCCNNGRELIAVKKFVEDEGPDYMDPSQVLKGRAYWFSHTLSDIIGGCLKHGLSLTHFEEYGHDISMVYAAFEHFDKKLPLSYSLIAQKTL